MQNLVFLAKTSSPTEWKAVVAAISALVEEATFEATAEGLTFRAMDPSHVALVDLNWPNSAFEKYTCDKQFKFTIRVEDLVKLIKRAEPKDSVEISSSNGQTLVLRMKNGYKREFQIHLIESSYDPTPLPKLSFNTKMLVIHETFGRILSDISAVADHVTIDSSASKMVFSGKSDRGSASITLDKANPDLSELDVKESSKATYGIDYLLNINKAAGSASPNIQCEYSSKMPMKLEFKLGESGGGMSFYLAPRIDEH